MNSRMFTIIPGLYSPLPIPPFTHQDHKKMSLDSAICSPGGISWIENCCLRVLWKHKGKVSKVDQRPSVREIMLEFSFEKQEEYTGVSNSPKVPYFMFPSLCTWFPSLITLCPIHPFLSSNLSTMSFICETPLLSHRTLNS